MRRFTSITPYPQEGKTWHIEMVFTEDFSMICGGGIKYVYNGGGGSSYMPFKTGQGWDFVYYGNLKAQSDDFYNYHSDNFDSQ